MTIILFIAVLFFLILVHELGHFVTAKWAKMRVDEFAIGFPPRLFSIKKGETEYSINLIPIGGYVKIFGENASSEAFSPVPSEARDRRYERSETGEGGQNGSDEPNNANHSRSFGMRPKIHQAIVLLAGVTMNVLVAWLIFFAVAMIGTPTAVSETDYNTEKAFLTITSTVPNSPADEAGIPSGAKVVGVQTEEGSLNTLTPTSFTNFVEDADGPVTIQYTHKGDLGSATIEPRAGVIESEPEREVVGVATALVENKKLGPVDALISATQRTVNSLWAITVGLSSFLASAFTLSANIEEVTGPIGIAGMVGDAAEFGFVTLMVFTAFISLNLAVINLLPIPALDGGRLLFVIAEAIIRRPINPEWMARVNLAGFALLILLMVAVTYNDLLRLF